MEPTRNNDARTKGLLLNSNIRTKNNTSCANLTSRRVVLVVEARRRRLAVWRITCHLFWVDGLLVAALSSSTSSSLAVEWYRVRRTQCNSYIISLMVLTASCHFLGSISNRLRSKKSEIPKYALNVIAVTRRYAMDTAVGRPKKRWWYRYRDEKWADSNFGVLPIWRHPSIGIRV